MRKIINNEKTQNKVLIYDENIWTGKRTIKYDGTILTKINRNLYEYKNGETSEQFKIKGNLFSGTTITMFGNEIELERRLTWYEIVLSIIVFIPCIMFGLVGGVIGGFLGAINLLLIRQFDKIYFKIIVSILFLAIGMLLSYIFAVLVFKMVFPYL